MGHRASLMIPCNYSTILLSDLHRKTESFRYAPRPALLAQPLKVCYTEPKEAVAVVEGNFARGFHCGGQKQLSAAVLPVTA